MVRLPEFILANTDAIVSEWEAFAQSVWPNGSIANPPDLRDHIRQILKATVRDMGTAQSLSQQAEKSKGESDDMDESEVLSASQVHGSGRVDSGFDLRSVIAEYRALRASVLRLWRASHPNPDAHDVDDITRFNESIDQSLARAVSSFTARIDRSRQMFLAVLGHDLRNPLAAIKVSAQAVKMTVEAAELAELLDGVLVSAGAMTRMIADLLDFASTGLGGNIPLHTTPADIARICREVANEARAAHPQAKIRLDVNCEPTGVCDPQRLRQVVSNLLGNALQHGDASQPIEIRLDGDEKQIRLTVVNQGPPIPPEMLATIFDPMVRAEAARASKPSQPGSLGLGLYIARAVLSAHGGTLGVESSADGGTRFIAQLPRKC